MRNVNRKLKKLFALCIILTMVLSGSSVGFAGSSDSSGQSDISLTASKARWAMTEEETIDVSFNLGYKPEAENIKWYLGDKELEQWVNHYDRSVQIFTLSNLAVAEDGTVTAQISTKYLFDGNDLAYWRPWYRYRGVYELKAVDTSTGKSASQEIRYEPYDSYHTYAELDATIEKIIAEKTNDIYMSWESTGNDTNGTPIKEVVVAKNKAAVDNWFILKERMENEPEAVLAELEAGTLTDYQIPIYITNIHANEPPGVDAQINFLKEIAAKESIEYQVSKDGTVKEYKIEEILDDIIIIVRPTENPYAMAEIQRSNVNGFDLNRDSTYQTQIESQVATADIAKWDPTTLVELHGFLYYSRASFSIEPCTPPHEPNLEYDLFMNYAVDGAKAFAEVASQNTKYHVTEENVEYLAENYPEYNPQVGDSWYEINILDRLVTKEDGTQYWDYPSDDMSSNYTPTYALFHGTIGYTVECGELNEESTKMHMYGLIGHTAWAAETKDELFKNQVEFFKRSVNNEEAAETEEYFVDQNNQKVDNFREKDETGDFYPDYYVIPLDGENQRDLADAYAMQEYFLRNDVEIEKLTEDITVNGVTYKAGSMIVPLAQPKRSMANVVLYKGKKVEGWSGLYSESVTNFPELRGFDCIAVTEEGVFEGKTVPITSPEAGASVLTGSGTKAIVISNDGLDSVNAVNELLANGVKVGFITEAGNGYQKGDFVIEYKDKAKISEEYVLELCAVNTVPKAKVITEPEVYIIEGGSNDVFAFTNQMNFKVVETAADANVVFGSSVPTAEDAYGEDAAARTAILESGMPFVGSSIYVLDFVKEAVQGFDFNGVLIQEETATGWEWVYNDYEALFKVDYEADSLVTASYDADGDDTIYTKGGAFITDIPEGAEVLIRAESGDDFYKAGWWNGVEALKGQVVAIDYVKDNLNMTVFSTSITNRGHQTDDYRLAVNAIYSKLLGDDFTVSSSGSYVPSVPSAPSVTPDSDTENGTLSDAELKELLAQLTPVARSEKTAGKNIRVTVKLDKTDKAIIEQIENAGYTVKYNYYRSLKKSADFESRLMKEDTFYINTVGVKGDMYYYKVRIQAYDEDGTLVGRTELKQCWYANRRWTR